jgi:hypothetical protein
MSTGVSVESGEKLFFRILAELDAAGVLQQIVLIGSWVLPVYRSFFGENPEIPLLRTTDIDFLVGNPPRITTLCDVPKILAGLGFETEWAAHGGYCKYVHPEMEVEFLIPEIGRGSDRSVSVKVLNVQAQSLRYLSMAYDYSMVADYRGLKIRVPDPEAFILLKILVIPRRKDKVKVEKDTYTVRALGGFLLSRPDRKEKLLNLFRHLPKSWQKTILQTSSDRFPEIYDQLSKDAPAP